VKIRRHRCILRAELGSPIWRSAWLMEPQISKRIRLVWIGGHEYEGIASPPPADNRSSITSESTSTRRRLFSINRRFHLAGSARCLQAGAGVGFRAAQSEMKEEGRLAGFLLGKLREIKSRAKGSLGETYILGDSPLVLLTALQSPWEMAPSSSRYMSMPTARITDNGLYESNPQGRQMRVYTHLDTRLMFEDFYAKVALFDREAETKKMNVGPSTLHPRLPEVRINRAMRPTRRVV